MAWQDMTGYARRNASETTMARYKYLIGPRLRARNAATQAGEVALAVQVINRMIHISQARHGAPELISTG